jgi:hypothetical protein
MFSIIQELLNRLHLGLVTLGLLLLTISLVIFSYFHPIQFEYSTTTYKDVVMLHNDKIYKFYSAYDGKEMTMHYDITERITQVNNKEGI